MIRSRKQRLPPDIPNLQAVPFRSVWGAKLHTDVRSVIETARRRGIGALEAILLTLRGQPLPVPA